MKTMAEKYNQPPETEIVIGYCDNCYEPLFKDDYPMDETEGIFCNDICYQSFLEEKESEAGG